MVRIHSLSHVVSKLVAIACLVSAPWTSAVAAQTPASRADDPPQAAPVAPLFHAPSRFTLKEPLTSIVAASPAEPDVFAQRGWGRRRWDRHGGARTAIILGSAAAIAGAAVLVYANRPDCSANHSASGCGYGTKVTGGALIAGGVVSIAVGALTWR